MLMLNGQHDDVSAEAGLKRLFRAFATPAKDKKPIALAVGWLSESVEVQARLNWPWARSPCVRVIM